MSSTASPERSFQAFLTIMGTEQSLIDGTVEAILRWKFTEWSGDKDAAGSAKAALDSSVGADVLTAISNFADLRLARSAAEQPEWVTLGLLRAIQQLPSMDAESFRAAELDAVHHLDPGGASITIPRPASIVDPYGLAKPHHFAPIAATTPPRFAARFRGAICLNAHLVLNSRLDVVSESFEKKHTGNIKHSRKGPTRENAESGLIDIKLKDQIGWRAIEGPALWATGPYKNGFADTLLKYAPCMAALKESGIHDYKIIVGEAGSEYLIPMLVQAGVPASDFIVHTVNEALFCSDLFIVSSPWQGDNWINLEAYDSFRPGFYNIRGFAGNVSPKRVYITRRKSNRRPIINENAIVELMEEHGFHISEMENLTYVEKQKLLQETEILVVPFGAGIMNALIAPKIRLLATFIHPNNTVTASSMSRIARIPEHHLILGRAVDPDFDVPGKGPFEVDLDSLRDFLEKLPPES